MRLLLIVLLASHLVLLPEVSAFSEGAQAVTPASEQAYQNALRLRASGNLLEAERQMVIALQESPQEAPYYFEMANIYAERHDRFTQANYKEESIEMLERASRELEQATMLDPSFIAARYNLGVIYKKLGQYERARQTFRQVIQEAEARDEKGVKLNALMQVGSVYEEQGFFDEAQDMYLEAREINYFDPSIKSALEDLKDRRKEYKARQMSQENFERMDLMSRNFQYGPNSHAARLQNLSNTDAQSSAGVLAAIPYLGAMLTQQLLNRKGELEDDWMYET